MSARLALCAAMLFVCPAPGATAQSVPAHTLAPEITIEGDTQQWSRLYGVFVAPNGSIIVSQRGDFAFSLFSPKGELIKQFGRKGEGPGEFRSASVAGLIGDSLWVSDGALRRVTILGLDGTVGRTIIPTGAGEWLKTFSEAGNYFSSTLLPYQLMPGNQALGGGNVNVDLISAGKSPKLAVLRMTWDGVANGMVADLPFGRAQLRFRVPGMNGTVSTQPFVADPQLVMTDAPQLLVADVTDDPSPMISLTYIGLKGDTIRRARVPFTPERITSVMIDSAVARIATSSKRVGHEDLIRQAIVIPKYNWPIGRVVMGHDGTTWVQLRSEDSVAQWVVVSPKGKVVETLRIPRSIDIQVIDRGIWGIAKDENDVPTVVKYRRQ